MARGNRREDIVRDDADRRRFAETLEEAVQSSGWYLYAWVLMSNHYHFLFKTPEPNLVAGMSWFQNTWTRRFNSRHRLWGRLFGDRYKAKPVEEGDYLTRLVSYIHLNPVRAGLVGRRRGVESYPWSSLPEYLKPRRKRCGWVAVERGLQHLELADTAVGRRRFLEWTEGCIDWKNPGKSGDSMPDGQSLQSTFRRGWYFGTEAFRDKLLEMLGLPEGDLSVERQKGYQGQQTRDRGLAEAERIVTVAEAELGLRNGEEWRQMKKGDWRKGLVGGIIRQRALVDNGWLAERLHMGARNAVSRVIREAKDRLPTDRNARRIAETIRSIVDSL
jgi:REP element-mobilizing transposase RayT